MAGTSSFTSSGIAGTPVDPVSPGGSLIDIPTEVAPATLDPSYAVFSGGSWGYSPLPAGGILNNYSALVDPTVNDDSGLGYAVGSEWANQNTGDVFKLIDSTPGSAVWILLTGGLGAPVGNEKSFAVDFAFNTVYPLIIGALNPGEKIVESEVKIINAFDDPAATAQLGLATSPTLIFGPTDIRLDLVTTYANTQNFDITAVESLRLNINPGASTQGNGQVLVTIRTT